MHASQRIFNTNILDLVEHVSESEGATPGSVISFEEEARQQSRLAKIWRLTKIAFDVLPVFKYLLSAAAAIIALWLIDRGIDVLEYFGYEAPAPRQVLAAHAAAALRVVGRGSGLTPWPHRAPPSRR